MKNNTVAASLFFSFLMLSTANAESQKAGFSGEVSLVSLMLATDSNLSTLNDATKNTNSLNSTGETEFRFIPGVLGKINYRFGDQGEHNVFLGTAREDIVLGALALESGYQYTSPTWGDVSFSYLPSILKRDVWQDPFVINEARQETKFYGNAYRIKFSQIYRSPFSAELAYAKAIIDHESSGEGLGLTPDAQALLDRSSHNYYAKVSFRQFLGKGWGISPSLSYLKSDTKGESLAFDEFGTTLSYFSFASRHKLVASLGYQSRHYDASHPVFLTKRKDNSIDLFFAYEYSAFFNIPSLSFISLNGYSKTDSNITFYEENQFLTSIGVSYKF